MKIKCFTNLVSKATESRPTPEKMPAGNYGFTTRDVTLSNTENDCALYVNIRVHGNDGMRNDISVRCQPGIDTPANWASAYSISNLIDAASPGSSEDFMDLMNDSIDALDEGNEEEFAATCTKMQQLVTSLVAGLNFDGRFTWNKSETTGRSYMNLRTSEGSGDDRKVTVTLSHTREPVTHEDNVPEGLKAKRTLVKGKR